MDRVTYSHCEWSGQERSEPVRRTSGVSLLSERGVDAGWSFVCYIYGMVVVVQS